MTIPKYGVGTQWYSNDKTSVFTITKIDDFYYGNWSGTTATIPYNINSVHNSIPVEKLLKYVPYLQIGQVYLTKRMDVLEKPALYRKFLGDGFWATGCDSVEQAKGYNEAYKNLNGDFITCVIVGSNEPSVQTTPKKKPRVLNPA